MSISPQPNITYPVTPETIESFLMHMLRIERLFNVGMAQLQPKYFNHPDETPYLILWTAAQRYYTQYRQLPNSEALSSLALSLAPQFKSITQEEVNELTSLLEYIYQTPTEGLDPTLALEYFKAFLCDRRLGDLMEDSLQLRRGAGMPDYPALVDECQRALRDIGTITGEERVPVLADGLTAYHCRAERTRGRQIIGLRTGLPILDERLCGVRGLILLGAAPGVGKTVFCCQIASGVCRHAVESGNDACVLFLSLDMNTDEMLDRLHCCLAGMDWKTYKLGSESLRGSGEGPYFREPHQQQIDQAAQKLRNWGIDQRLSILGRDEVGTLTASRIAALAAGLKRQTESRHCLIIVDYLQLLDVDKNVAKQGDLEVDKHRVRMVQHVLDASKDAGGHVTDSLIAISEARKPTVSKETKDSWGHKIEDLMGSARLGYAPDAVLLLRGMNNEELQRYYQRNGTPLEIREELSNDGTSPLMIELAKGRDGMTRGKWPAEFQFRRSVISEGVPRAPAASPVAVLGQPRVPIVRVAEELLDVDLDDDDAEI